MIKSGVRENVKRRLRANMRVGEVEEFFTRLGIESGTFRLEDVRRIYQGVVRMVVVGIMRGDEVRLPYLGVFRVEVRGFFGGKEVGVVRFSSSTNLTRKVRGKLPVGYFGRASGIGLGDVMKRVKFIR